MQSTKRLLSQTPLEDPTIQYKSPRLLGETFSHYRVSSTGRLFSGNDRGPVKTKYWSELQPGKDGKVELRSDRGARYHALLGRLVGTLFGSEPGFYDVVRFRDGNCQNTHPSNLIWEDKCFKAAGRAYRLLAKGRLFVPRSEWQPVSVPSAE